jgi:hypothetical protein
MLQDSGCPDFDICSRTGTSKPWASWVSLSDKIREYWRWAEVRADLKNKKIRKSIVALAHKFERWLLEQKGETMSEIKRNENEPPEHNELRYLLQEAKAIVLPMTPTSEKEMGC